MNKILGILDNLFGGGTIGKVVDRTLDRIIPDKIEREKIKTELERDLRQHSFKVLQTELQDLQSARNMQVEALKQDDLFSKRFLYYLTAVLLGATTIISVIPFFYEYPKENLSIITRATDFLYTISGAQIIAFFFGRSKSNINQNFN